MFRPTINVARIFLERILVAFFSSGPILNRLFTNRSTVRDERTLLILVKPTIIIQREEEELRYE